ncbi:MAG: hypothetical protein KY468_20860 [Armatimonadetes bacterium]|nr:hypothetical protein [Armatimonadota bacterium]
MDTEQRINALERQVRQFRILCGVIALTALAAVLAGADKPPQVTTLKAPLRVVDEKGNSVFVINSEDGESQAYLYGANGKGLTVLNAGPDGSGLVVSGNLKNENPDITLITTTDGSALLMNGPKSKKGVEVAASAEGGDISVYDAKGATKR